MEEAAPIAELGQHVGIGEAKIGLAELLDLIGLALQREARQHEAGEIPIGVVSDMSEARHPAHQQNDDTDHRLTDSGPDEEQPGCA